LHTVLYLKLQPQKYIFSFHLKIFNISSEKKNSFRFRDKIIKHGKSFKNAYALLSASGQRLSRLQVIFFAKKMNAPEGHDLYRLW